jgi:hypothetical protein
LLRKRFERAERANVPLRALQLASLSWAKEIISFGQVFGTWITTAMRGAKFCLAHILN